MEPAEKSRDELIINQTYDLLDKKFYDGKYYVLPRPQGLSTIDRIDVRNFKGELQPYLTKPLENIKVKIYALPSVDALTLNINFNSGSSTPIRRYQFDSSQNAGKIAPLFEIEQSWFYDPDVQDQFYNNIMLAIAKISHYFDPSFSRYVSIKDYKYIPQPLKFYNSKISSNTVYNRIVGSNTSACQMTKQIDYAACQVILSDKVLTCSSINPAWTFINGLFFGGIFVSIVTGNRHIMIEDTEGLNEYVDIYGGWHNWDNSCIMGCLYWDPNNEEKHLVRRSLFCRNGNSGQLIKHWYDNAGVASNFEFPRPIVNVLAMHNLDGTNEGSKIAMWYEMRAGRPIIVCYCDSGTIKEFTVPYVEFTDANICLCSVLIVADNRNEEDPTNVQATIINNVMSFRIDFKTGQYAYIGRFFDGFLRNTIDIINMKNQLLFNIDVKYSLEDFDYTKFYMLGSVSESVDYFDYGVFTNSDALQLVTDHLTLINDPVFTASFNAEFPIPRDMHGDIFSDSNGAGVLCFRHINDSGGSSAFADGSNIYTFTTFRCEATDIYRLYADLTSSYKSDTITYEMKNTDINTNFATAPLNAEYYKLVTETGEFNDDMNNCFITTPVMCMKYKSGGTEYIVDPVVNFGLTVSTNDFEFTTGYSTLTSNDYTLTNQILPFKFRSNESFESIVKSYNMRILLQNEYNNLYIASPSMNNLNSIIYYLNEEAKIRFKSIQVSPNASQLLVNINSDDAEQLTPDDLKAIYGSVTVSIDWIKRF